MRMKKLGTFLILNALLFGLLASQVKGADSTAASIELSSNSYLANTPVTIRVYDVTAAGSEFLIYFTYDSSGTDTIESTSKFTNITVYLGTDADEWVFTKNFPAPTAGSYIRVHVCETTWDATDLADATIYVQEINELVNLDLFIEVGIYVMIILIFLGIVFGLPAYAVMRKARSR